MRVLLTGSSGQIGTNLALRLIADGHQVFGVDKRLNTWVDAFPYLLQDLSGHYPASPGGIGGVEAFLNAFCDELRVALMLCGCAKVEDLTPEHAVVGGRLLEWVEQRGLQVKRDG